MAVTAFTGFEGGEIALDGPSSGTPAITGTAAISTNQARTGTRSLRCNPASGASGYVTNFAAPSRIHFGLYIATMPSVTRLIQGESSGAGSIRLNSDGTIGVHNTAGTLVSTSTIAMTTGTWYWIGVKFAAATAEQIIQIDGVATGGTVTHGAITASTRLGCGGTEASAIDVYYDDFIADNAGFLASSKVIDLVPTANSAVGTGWTLGSGGTTGQWDAVNNQPPVAVADAGTTNQIRNATSNANSNYDATLQTYTVGGVGGSDTVLAVQNITSTAAPVTTSAKLGTVGNVSNPAITNINLAAGGTSGAFWSGVAGGTYPTGWKVSKGTLTASPSVTVGTAPVMRVTQVTASTRIAMVSYMALRVAWTPVTGAQTVTPTTAALVITKNIPTVTVSNNQAVTPTTKALTSATYAPTVRLGTVITVPTAGGAGYAAAVVASSPVAYYRMGEPSGSVLDSIGSAHGTTTGTVTRDATGLIASGAGDDGAIDFSGSGYWSATWPSAIANVWTIEAWVTIPASGSGFVTFIDNNADRLSISINQANGQVICYLGAAFNRQANSTTGAVANGGTYHIVWTRSGHSPVFTTNKVYVNGVDVSLNSALNGIVNPDTATTFRVGETTTGSESFLGKIDELAIYSTTLSAADVLAHYTAGTTSGGLVLTTYAPAIRQGISVIPTTKTLTATKYAPTITVSNHQRVTPTTATVVLTKYAPTVTASSAQTVTPGTAAITTTKYAPTVTAHQHVTVTPTTAALADTQYAPTVMVSNHQRVTPTTTNLAATKYAPQIRTPILATPTTKALTATRYAPTVRTPQTVTPAAKALTVTKFAPTITNPQTYVPATAVLVATKYAPSVSVSSASTIVPANASLAIARFAPTVTASNRQIATPPTAAIATTRYAPTIRTPQTVTPTTRALTATKYAPTVTASSQQGIVPGTKALAITRYAPTVSVTAHASVVPSTKVLQLTKFAPSARVANRATPASKALTITTLAPIVTPTLNTLVRPAPFVLTLTRYPAILGASGHQYPEPITATLVTMGYAPDVEIHSNTPLPEFIYGFAIVATGDSGSVGTAQGGATVTASEGGSTAVSMTGPSARVTIR